MLDNAKLKILFYCHGVGKITSDKFVERLLLLTASVKAERILPTPSFAKKIRTMWHSAESRLPTMPHSAEFKKKVLSATLCYDVKFKSEIFLSTPRYAAQRGVATPRYTA
jgi:hypothetical protein